MAGSPGIINTPAHTAVTVGSSSTAVLSASETAAYRLMVNDSDEVIYINLGGTAAANTGIRLNASGGSYEMSVAGGNWFNGAITAICASGSKKLLVTQGTA